MRETLQVRWGIKSRLVLLIGGMLIFSGMIFGLLLLNLFKKNAQEQIREQGLRMAGWLVSEATESLASDTPEISINRLRTQVSNFGAGPDILYLVVFDKDGAVRAGVNDQKAKSLLGGVLAPPPLITTVSVSEKMDAHETFLDVVMPIVTRESLGPVQGWVRLGISLNRAEALFRQMAWKMGLLLIFLGICGGVGAVFFAQSLEASLENIAEAADRMGEGDLSSSVEQGMRDAFGRLGVEGGGHLIPRLRSTLHPVRTLVLKDETVVQELSQSVQRMKGEMGHRSQLSQKKLDLFETINSEFQKALENIETLSVRTQTIAPTLIEMSAATVQVNDSMANLASYVEDTASALLQMSSSIKQVVEHINALTENMSETTASCGRMDVLVNEIETRSKEAALLAEKVSKDAEGLGGGAIEKTINGMENIRKAVEKSSSVIFKLGERTEYIGKILTVIDEVTRQTNLLALNAAILAAQAGEHGRGFAVVADEIKGLADRTATSTKEIAKLIQDLQSEAQDAVTSIREGGQSVEEGVRLSLDARQSLNSILEEATQSAAASRQIEKSTLAQVQAIRIVNQAIDKMNQMVHQVNSAMNEQGKMIEHITEGSEKMRLITRQVKSATEEQAIASKQTSSAIEELANGIQGIGEGMNVQKKEAEAMRVWTLETDQVADLNRKLIDAINQGVEELIKNVQALKTQLGHFKM